MKTNTRALSSVLATLAAITGLCLVGGAAQAADQPEMLITDVSLTCTNGAASSIEWTVQNTSQTAGVYSFQSKINDYVVSGEDGSYYFPPDDSLVLSQSWPTLPPAPVGPTGEESLFVLTATGSLTPDGTVLTLASKLVDNVCLRSRPLADSDADGIADGADLCPGTATGDGVFTTDLVDVDGCSAEQRDSDRPVMSITNVGLTCTNNAVSSIEWTVTNISQTAGVYDFENHINDRTRSQTNYFQPNDNTLVREFFGSVGFTGLTGEESQYVLAATGSLTPDGTVMTLASTTVENLCPASLPPEDSDGDGVADATDACPGTTTGAAVDIQGCAATQRDSDSDTGGSSGDGSTAPVPPAAPEGTTEVETAASSDPEGTATATSDQTTVEAYGRGAFTVGQYTSTPVGSGAPIDGTPLLFDVKVSDDSSFTSIAVRQCGLSADAQSVVWYDGTEWVKATPVTFSDGCATLTITGTSSPTLNQLSGTVFAAGELPVTRLAGPDRVATAVAVSKDRFPGSGSASAVVLATSEQFPDALAGAPLASAKHAPLLLTGSAFLDRATLDEIKRVLPVGSKVYLLGGKAALAPPVRTRLREAGYKVERLGGSDRYATAISIAEELGSPKRVVEVSGTGFADGVSAGPAAARLGAAILLTKGGEQAPATADYLLAHPGGTHYAVGGWAAKADPGAVRIAGRDRYETSARVAAQLFPEAKSVKLATGLAFPDALSGGTNARVPILLVPGTADDLPSSSAEYLEASAETVIRLYALGGTTVLDDEIVDQAQQLLR